MANADAMPKETRKDGELADHGSEIAVKEIEQTTSESDKGYVYMWMCCVLCTNCV